MNEDAAARALLDEVALWQVHPARGPHDVIWAAVDALTAGLDSPSLRELAGLSAQDSAWTVQPLVDATLDELGISLAGQAPEDVRIAAARAMSARLVSGKVSVRDFTNWAHKVIGHEGSENLQPLVLLDDYLDEFESAGNPTATIDAEALSMAKQLLADDLPLTEALIWPPGSQLRMVPPTRANSSAVRRLIDRLRG